MGRWRGVGLLITNGDFTQGWKQGDLVMIIPILVDKKDQRFYNEKENTPCSDFISSLRVIYINGSNIDILKVIIAINRFHDDRQTQLCKDR